MTQTPGGGPPEDPRDGEPEQPPATPPPYPGWSTEQPPPAAGWSPPGPQPPSWAGGTPQPPPAAPWTDQPANPPPWAGPEPQQQPPAWAAPAPPPPGGWGWQPAPPAAKPGVVPLRPLGVGELLDGAVTTLRQNPAAMLGLSAVVAAVSQVFQLAALWLFYRDLAVLENATVVTGADVASVLSDSLGALGVGGIVSFLATIVLTGILTVVVSRAVLGERVSIGRAWAMARPQLLRLLGLTVVVAVLVSLPLLVAVLPAAALAVAGGSGGAVAVLAVLGVLAGVPLAVWVYVRVALATPALVLETSAGPDGSPRRSTVMESLRRSGRLVQGSWWRVFGILLLAYALAWIISQVVAVPAAVVTALIGGFSDSATLTLPGLVVTGLAGIVSATITAPFTAGVVVLLYVDRRIRREGLDIELARAAGVSLPGPAAAPGQQSPGQPYPGQQPPGPPLPGPPAR